MRVAFDLLGESATIAKSESNESVSDLSSSIESGWFWAVEPFFQEIWLYNRTLGLFA